MKPKAYIETTIVSYLTAWPSRDLIRAAHQQVTHDWWAARASFDLFISQLVVDEAAAGDQDAARQRLDALREATILDITEDAILLAEKLIAGECLPTKARVDALHIAIATVHGIDYRFDGLEVVPGENA